MTAQSEQAQERYFVGISGLLISFGNLLSHLRPACHPFMKNTFHKGLKSVDASDVKKKPWKGMILRPGPVCSSSIDFPNIGLL